MKLPLIDLHCHLEGAASPTLIRALAARNGVQLPADLFNADGSYLWKDFSHFLESYDAACQAIRKPEDFFDLAYTHFSDAARLGMIYGEVFISADHAAASGIAYPEMLTALEGGFSKARAQTGVEGRFVLTAIRHYGVEKAEQTAALAHEFPHPLVTGFGIAGDEAFGQPADFARAFDVARNAGLGITVHAGEVCGPQSIAAALDALKPARIGHGVAAIGDASLVARLADEGVVLEICPGSNIAVGVYGAYGQSPFLRLRDAGVKVSLGADDPPYFHTDIANEYAQVQQAFDLSAPDMLAISKTAIEAAFCDDATKAKLLEKL